MSEGNGVDYGDRIDALEVITVRTQDRVDGLEAWRELDAKQRRIDSHRIERTHAFMEALGPRLGSLEDEVRSHDNLILEAIKGQAEAMDMRYRSKLPSLREYEPQVNEDGSASLPPGAFTAIQESVARQREETDKLIRQIALKDQEIAAKEAAAALKEAASEAEKRGATKAIEELEEKTKKQREAVRYWAFIGGLVIVAATWALTHGLHL